MFASSALVATPRGPLFVRRTGEADVEPVLFVHGLGGESLDWADVVELLAGHVDAYALDLPGFGESPPASDRDFSIDGHARAVVAAIHAIGRGRVHLVGNSLGGAVATRVAAEHPELVRSLALLSPALPDLRPRWPAWELLLTLLPVIGPHLVTSALHGDPERTARQVFATCYGYPAAVTGQRWTAELEAIRRRADLAHGSQVYCGSLRSLVATYLQAGRRRLWRQAAQVGVRTLLIYGGRDRLVDWRKAERAEATFRDARTVLMLDAGHVAHLELPARVAAVLREFYAERPLNPGMVTGRGTVEGSADVAVPVPPAGRRLC